MPHYLVDQLRFAKEAFIEGLEDLSAEDAAKHVGRANSISWMIGHLAEFDQYIWLTVAQGKTLYASLAQFGYGEPATTPLLTDVLKIWHEVDALVAPYLGTLSTEQIDGHLTIDGEPSRENVGTILLRQTWHYWYHLGEAQTIRQGLGHKDLLQYVGRLDDFAMHRPHS